MKKKMLGMILLILSFCALSGWAAQKTLTTYTWDVNIGIQNSPLNINFENDLPNFTHNPSTPGAVVADLTNKSVSLGNGLYNSCGVLWYGGTKNVANSICTDGKCNFGSGFRAFFEMRIRNQDTSANSSAYGDGFTFTVMNGENNDISRRGGPRPGVSMGELMCSAGSGNTADGLGLRYPKFSIEFDTYPNTGGMTYNGCTGGRVDAGNNNHIAVLFWGNNQSGNCHASSTVGSSYAQITYDDNIHTIPASASASTPRNSYSGDGTGGFYERAMSTYNWLEDNAWHLVRLEVTRNVETNTYNIKTWVDCETPTGSATCSIEEINNYFKDLFNQYYNSINPRSGSVAPKLNRTVTLNSTLPSFDTMLFGFTQATGGATQMMDIRNFEIFFIGTSTCSHSIAPSGVSVGASGVSGATVSVSAESNCPWTAVSNNTWITVTGGAAGMGNGTVTYNVAPNTDSPRTGTITIAGRTFAVSQQVLSPPTCGLAAGSSIIPYGGNTSLTWVITNGPANAAWSGSPGGNCGSFSGSTSGTCTTGNQTTAGTRTFTLTVSNAAGSNSCSATVYVGCQNYRVWNQLGARYDFLVGSQCENNINNNNEITTNNQGRRLDPGETIQTLNDSGTCGGSARGVDLDYADAMNADIGANGGNGNCQVNFTGNHSAADR